MRGGSEYPDNHGLVAGRDPNQAMTVRDYWYWLYFRIEVRKVGVVPLLGSKTEVAVKRPRHVTLPLEDSRKGNDPPKSCEGPIRELPII